MHDLLLTIFTLGIQVQHWFCYSSLCRTTEEGHLSSVHHPCGLQQALAGAAWGPVGVGAVRVEVSSLSGLPG